ncbi:polyprenyl diphosphate synthase [Rickettsiales endosymbiont of Stachyamoeba lipophora]|uniref:polyprenyl diphosphate synthase n=1 Tax=Rickettsiales endosymbiont of Stachyamoeba lipophora TaxID=2486578 RepID=UPI000F6531E7|nr:polyprenyl diphosphate synthase [Rickettsiales endosymbiont of Stachyamoeba lipophora]AZL15079.1 di-trans,poly-cis-decaprenylcistransferase [Rickettsiales endosymbiont of Stachyamoeba lipophora]
MHFDTERLHVGMIMDGNGRWAKQRFFPRIEGHRRGSQALKAIVEHAPLLGVKFLSVFAFSTENWNRSSHEINDLMNLLRFYLKHEVEFFNKLNVKLNVIGAISKLPSDIASRIESATEATAKNDGLQLTIALSYGGKEEIVDATKKICNEVMAGNFDINNLNEINFGNFLYDPNLPMVDILIRTSGEQRISNFMLWYAAYAELFFTQTLWPDITIGEFENIIEQYKHRERRFGGRLAYNEY